MSKVHARSHEITNKPLRVRTTETLWLPTWKTNYNAEKCASDVKKMMNHRKVGGGGEGGWEPGRIGGGRGTGGGRGQGGKWEI